MQTILLPEPTEAQRMSLEQIAHLPVISDRELGIDLPVVEEADMTVISKGAFEERRVHIYVAGVYIPKENSGIKPFVDGERRLVSLPYSVVKGERLVILAHSGKIDPVVKYDKFDYKATIKYSELAAEPSA